MLTGKYGQTNHIFSNYIQSYDLKSLCLEYLPAPPLCPCGGRASSVYQHVHRLNHSSIELQCEKDGNIITTHARKRCYTNQWTIGRLSADAPKRKVVTAANQKILELLILRLCPDKGKL